MKVCSGPPTLAARRVRSSRSARPRVGSLNHGFRRMSFASRVTQCPDFSKRTIRDVDVQQKRTRQRLFGMSTYDLRAIAAPHRGVHSPCRLAKTRSRECRTGSPPSPQRPYPNRSCRRHVLAVVDAETMRSGRWSSRPVNAICTQSLGVPLMKMMPSLVRLTVRGRRASASCWRRCCSARGDDGNVAEWTHRLGKRCKPRSR